MSHTVLFIKLGVQRSNLSQCFSVSVLSRWSPQLGLQCLVQRFSSEATTRQTTPPFIILPLLSQPRHTIRHPWDYWGWGQMRRSRAAWAQRITLFWICFPFFFFLMATGMLLWCCWGIPETRCDLYKEVSGRSEDAYSAFMQTYSCLHWNEHHWTICCDAKKKKKWNEIKRLRNWLLRFDYICR